MENDIEYQIYIGTNDSQINRELVKDHELVRLVADFFERKQIDFSILNAKGGYLYKDGSYTYENAVCINLIGAAGKDIIKLAQSISMIMNQDKALVVRHKVKRRFQ